MEKFKNIFRALNTSWLLRHYAYVIMPFIAFYLFDINSFSGGQLVFLTICSAFYPFAMYVYESIVNFFVGENLFILPLKFVIIWKVVRFVIIWLFSIPIGLIGLIYLYYKVNKGQSN